MLTLIPTFPGLITVATLLGCEVEALKLTLSTRKMRVGKDNIIQKLTASQAWIHSD